MSAAERAFLEQSRTYLSAGFLPRIRGAVEQLSEDDLWWRPNEASNSVGNLLLHLSGNLRQWIVSGVGGAADERRRQEEFDTRERIPRDVLMDRLTRTVEEAVAALSALPTERLLDSVTIQGRTVSVLEAIYHAVEHFSMHTGQIMYIVKLRSGRDLRFYELVDGIPRARWAGHAKE